MLLGAIVGLVVLVAFGWVTAAGLLDRSMPPGSTLALIVIGVALVLVLAGVGSVGTDAPGRMGGLLLLALGVRLRTEAASTDRTKPAPEATSR